MANHEAWAVGVHLDESYVEELFRARYLEMVRLAGLLGADDPEDIAQEAFTRLMIKEPDLGDAQAAPAYLRTIVVNLTRNRHRHMRVVRLRGPAAAGPDSCEQAAIAYEDHQEVIAALAGLPARRREAIVLRYWLDLPEREIAAVMGVSPGTVKSHLSRGLAALAVGGSVPDTGRRRSRRGRHRRGHHGAGKRHLRPGYGAPSHDQIQLCHITTDVPGGGGGGFCWPLPGPPAGQLATVTGNEGEDVAGRGMRMAVGTAATGQVYTLMAVSDDDRAYPGTVVAGSGFPYEAWTVSYPASSRVRLEFLNAKGKLAATLSPTGPSGLPQTPLPISGGVPVFHYTPGADAPADTTLGYLIGGRGGFISPLRGMVVCELSASSAPALGALLEPLDNFRGGDSQPVEAFGYAHADVARVVLHLPGGRVVSTPTFAAGLAGSDLRLWAVPMPFVIRNERPLPSVTATGESATGHVLGQVQLGRVE